MDNTASSGRFSQFRSPQSITGFEFGEEVAKEDDDEEDCNDSIEAVVMITFNKIRVI
ncbi:hypothetical protein A2U01_0039105 [Trifolium medium]|uniref:Uncharacterized protein n=1 Tax=Trifolium medium TaxID=97028 RepID=A0A392Q1H5_9FABA|nr:hypothetical protein [Trifolium medium]